MEFCDGQWVDPVEVSIGERPSKSAYFSRLHRFKLLVPLDEPTRDPIIDEARALTNEDIASGKLSGKSFLKSVNWYANFEIFAMVAAPTSKYVTWVKGLDALNPETARVVPDSKEVADIFVAWIQNTVMPATQSLNGLPGRGNGGPSVKRMASVLNGVFRPMEGKVTPTQDDRVRALMGPLLKQAAKNPTVDFDLAVHLESILSRARVMRNWGSYMCLMFSSMFLMRIIFALRSASVCQYAPLLENVRVPKKGDPKFFPPGDGCPSCLAFIFTEVTRKLFQQAIVD
jgi:hypothetical protein